MVAIATGYEVAGEFLHATGVHVPDGRVSPIKSVDRDVARFVHQLGARGDTSLYEVFGDLRLPVDRDTGSGVSPQIHTKAAFGESQGEAIVHQAIAQHAFADPRLDQ